MLEEGLRGGRLAVQARRARFHLVLVRVSAAILDDGGWDDVMNVACNREKNHATFENTEREREGGGGCSNSKKTLIFKDSSVRSTWTYLTASPCYTTNTNKHDNTTNR